VSSSVFARRRPRNQLLRIAVLAELGMLAAFLYIPPLAGFLDHSGPNAWGWGVALLAAPAVIAADTAHKAWLKRHGGFGAFG
jgi:Cation transporting ATPase, C-terminus